MRNSMKRWIVFAIIIVVALMAMIQFKVQHSAKERLREEGIRYYRMARYEDAKDCFSLALKQKDIFFKGMDKDIYLYLADGEMKQNNFTSAMTYYEKLIQLKETGFELYANVGICQEKLKHYDKAYTYLKKALDEKPTDTDMIYHLCEVCILTDRTQEAKEFAKKGYACMNQQLTEDDKKLLATQNGQNLRMTKIQEFTKYSQLAYLSGNYKDAYTYYKMLEQTGEQKFQLYMGHCLAEMGNYDEAIAVFNDYISKNGNDPLADAKLVYCYMQKKEYETALSLVEQALNDKNQTLQKELLYEKGVALEHMGQFDDAFDCFAQYVKENPNDENGKREYDFLLTRISDKKAKEAGVSNGNE